MASAVASLTSLLSRPSIDDHDEALRTADAALAAARGDEDTAVARHAKAVALLKLDRFDEALRVLADHPRQDGFCLLERAYALYKTGRLDEALALCQKSPEGSRALRHLAAQAAYRADDYATASQLYDELTADLRAVDERGEYSDLRANEVAARGQLAAAASAVSGLHSREDAMTYEITYNDGCESLGRGNYDTAAKQLKWAQSLCERSDVLSDEDKKAEVPPIVVQRAHALARLGQVTEAVELLKTIDVTEIPEGSTRAIADHNTLVLGDESNPYMMQKLFESITPPASGSDRLFKRQADILQRNKYIIELQCQKFKGVETKTAKALAAEKEVGQSTSPTSVGLGVLRAAAKAKLQTGKDAIAVLLPQLESRPDDVGLVLTVIQLYIQAKKPDPATTVLESFFERLDKANTPEDADVRFAPGLVALAVSLYKLQGRQNAVRSELGRAVTHWLAKTDSSWASAASLLRGASVELLRSHSPADLAKAGTAFEQLVSPPVKDFTQDNISKAGLVASFATSDYSKTEPHLRSLSDPSKYTKDIDVDALLARGVASLPSPGAAGALAGPTTGQKRPAAGAAAAGDDAAGRKKRRRGARKLPKDYDPNKKVDPERWLPLRDRSSYRPKGRKGKKRAAEATQGGLPVARAGGGGGGGGGGDEETIELAGGAGSVRVEKAPQGGGGGVKKKKKGKK